MLAYLLLKPVGATLFVGEGQLAPDVLVCSAASPLHLTPHLTSRTVCSPHMPQEHLAASGVDTRPYAEVETAVRALAAAGQKV